MVVKLKCFCDADTTFVSACALLLSLSDEFLNPFMEADNLLRHSLLKDTLCFALISSHSGLVIPEVSLHDANLEHRCAVPARKLLCARIKLGRVIALVLY